MKINKLFIIGSMCSMLSAMNNNVANEANDDLRNYFVCVKNTIAAAQTVNQNLYDYAINGNQSATIFEAIEKVFNKIYYDIYPIQDSTVDANLHDNLIKNLFLKGINQDEPNHIYALVKDRDVRLKDGTPVNPQRRIFVLRGNAFGVDEFSCIAIKGSQNLDKSWNFFVKLFTEYCNIKHNESSQNVRLDSQNNARQLSSIPDSQSIHFLDHDEEFLSALEKVRVENNGYEDVDYDNVLQMFADIFEAISNDGVMADILDALGDDAHSGIIERMRNISQDKQDKDIIKELYVRAVANILYYEKQLFENGLITEEINVEEKVAEFKEKVGFYDDVDINPHNEEGVDFDLPGENDRYRGGMHLLQVAKLLKFLIDKVQYENTKRFCYRELVISMIDNIVAGGGCYQGYINRLGLSVLLVDTYKEKNL